MQWVRKMPVLERDTATTQKTWRFDASASADVISFSLEKPRATQTGARSAEVQKAVFTYIQALRALGKTRVNTHDIATALELPRPVVEQAVRHLKEKGVKIAQ